MCESGRRVNRGNVPVLYRTKQQRSHSQIVKRTIINITIRSKFIISPLSHLHPFDLAGQHLISVRLHCSRFILVGFG